MIRVMLMRTWRDVLDILTEKDDDIAAWRVRFETAQKASQINAERAERVMRAYDALLAADKEDPTRLAQVVAQWDAVAQGKFLNELAAAPVKLGWTNWHDKSLVHDGEGQWYHVAKELDEVGAKLVSDLQYFVEHRGEA